MALTTLPTEVDGELGVDKADVDAPRDRVHTLPGDEWNTLKKAVAELVQAVGLGDGSTFGSLEAMIAAVGSPLASSAFSLVDDFWKIDSDAWTETETAAGTVSLLDGSAAAETGEQIVGAIELSTGVVADYASLIDSSLFFTGEEYPVFQARIKTPSAFTNADFILGLGNVAGGSHTREVTLQPTATGWDAVSQGSGGSTTTSDAGTAPSVSTWYDVKVAIIPATGEGNITAVFYVDDVLIATHGVILRVPDGDDDLGRFVSLNGTGTAARTARVDFIDLGLTRE